MKIMITGATGFIGQYVTRYALSQGHQVVIVSRNRASALNKFNSYTLDIIEHDLLQTPLPKDSFNQVEAIINLMGENIADKRWSESQKKILEDSRIQGTKHLLQHLPETVQVVSSASALGIYAPHHTQEYWTEDSPVNNDFLGSLCVNWEKEITKCPCRSVIIRIGAALGREGGILKPLLPVFQMGLGGPIGSGQHLMSWMHVKDLARLFVTAIENSNYSGVYNAVVGEPISNKLFSKTLAKALRRPSLFPVPPFMLKVILGSELGTIALGDQSAISHRLDEAGFVPEFKTIEDALNNLY